MNRHSRRSALLMLGAFGLTAQMIVFRELFVLFAGNELYIGFVFSSWLLWAGAGSALLGKARPPDGKRTLEGGVLFGSIILLLSVMAVRAVSPAVIAVPGEIVPYGTALPVAFFAAAPCGLLAGYLFAFASRLLQRERIRSFEAGGAVYAWEAWGSGLAGILFGAVIFTLMGTFIAAALFCALSAAFAAWRKIRAGRGAFVRASAALLPLVLCVLSMPVLKRADLRLESRRLPGYAILRSADSPYGRINAAVREDQSVLFVNTVPVASSPDPASAEEMVHIPMLCHPSPRTVLMLGGTMGDVPGELAKHHVDRAVGVELDGKALELARNAGFARMTSPMTIHTDDPRVFLAVDGSRYDVIICGMGEPASLQMNRYYTRQFFGMVRARLAPGGIFGIALPGSENVSLPAQEGLLRCVYATLREVFPSVCFLPGGTCHFIAGIDTLPSDLPGRIVRGMRERDIRTTHLMPSALEYRFSDMRMNAAAGIARPSPDIEINDDFGFSGYIYDMIGWHSRLGFTGAERLYPLIGRRRDLFLASFLLLVILYAAAALGSLGRPRRRIAVAAVLVAGFSGMAGGIALLVAFQVLCSALYQWVTILTGTFMAGAGAGSALIALRRGAFASFGGGAPKDPDRGARSAVDGTMQEEPDGPDGGTLPVTDGGRVREAGLPLLSADISKAALVHFLLLSLFSFLAVVLLMIERRPIPAGMMKPLFLFMEWSLGLLTGGAFVIACGIMGEGEGVAPVLYGVDLVGGCLGAALFAGVMLPLLGLPLGLLLLSGFNAAALAASAFAMRN